MQTPAVQWTDPERHRFFSDWCRALAAPYRLNLESLQIASADASFRRYLRVDSQLDESGGSLIIMDAPPTKEDCAPFVRIAGLMDAAGLVVPKILDWNRTHGFILMRDLGNQTMMAAIDPANATLNLPLYLEAVDCLIQWQLASRTGVLPDYNAALLRREQPLSERTKTLMTYALCGFSNFSAIGIQIGGIGSLAPGRRNDIAQLGLRAMIGGTIACLMTACIAGIIV